ncbi:jg2041 [Pararge aegeria aegeria]|uniref:Jg2041 protein n=1 Tax=Pararge aegeria aegeria TaxID=348720 RepID=A0A8S4R7D6_9NEOP|nr:jg2041 [Pararge aegeria aegeria]
MLRVSWNAFRTNKSILEEICIAQLLSFTVQALILTFFGHVSRSDNDSIEHLFVQGRIEGTRSRGRSGDLPRDLSELGRPNNGCSGCPLT